MKSRLNEWHSQSRDSNNCLKTKTKYLNEFFKTGFWRQDNIIQINIEKTICLFEVFQIIFLVVKVESRKANFRR